MALEAGCLSQPISVFNGLLARAKFSTSYARAYLYEVLHALRYRLLADACGCLLYTSDAADDM
eukprot:1812352-Lingulodinium_polyedra.AAC.1